MKYPDLNNYGLEKLNKWVYDFSSIYNFNSSFYFKSEKTYALGDKANKICRYCKKGINDTTFKTNAHLAPKLIGNLNIICHYECDNCNSLFGKYESDLANFIGIRGFYDSKENYDKKRKRVYKSKSGKSFLYNSKRGIEISDLGNEIFEELPDNKGLKCIAKKSPFIPLNVYKSLVKIVLASLRDDIINQFQKTIDFLITDKYDNDDMIKKLSKLSIITLDSFDTDYPIIFTFVRNPNLTIKSEVDNIVIPHKTFIIFFRMFCYQIFIPFDINDKLELNKVNDVKLILHPPAIFQSNELNYRVFPNYFHEFKDLSSNVQVRDENDVFYILNCIEPIHCSYSEEEREMLIKKYNLRK